MATVEIQNRVESVTLCVQMNEAVPWLWKGHLNDEVRIVV
jgi:hypothetical protein